MPFEDMMPKILSGAARNRDPKNASETSGKGIPLLKTPQEIQCNLKVFALRLIS